MFVIVTNKHDITADFLLDRAVFRGVKALRLNTEDIGSHNNLGIFFDGDRHSALCLTDALGKRIFSDQISAIYLHHPVLPQVTSLVADEFEFANAQYSEFLRSAWRLIPDSKWLNPPHRILFASNKVTQLKRAQEIGFQIPNTIITSDKALISEFFEKWAKCGVVIKSVKHSFMRGSQGYKLAPTVLAPDNYLTEIDSFANIPYIYQEKIDKKYEIRVTVVGEKVFGCAIDSQAHPISEIDWRVASLCGVKLKQWEIELPSFLKKKCQEFVKSFGLQFSAFDFIYTHDQDYVFLENNPNGQWAWIELQMGTPIRDAIIETLYVDRVYG